MQKTFLACFHPESVTNCTIQRLAFQIHCMSNPVYTEYPIVYMASISNCVNSLYILLCIHYVYPIAKMNT